MVVAEQLYRRRCRITDRLIKASPTAHPSKRSVKVVWYHGFRPPQDHSCRRKSNPGGHCKTHNTITPLVSLVARSLHCVWASRPAHFNIRPVHEADTTWQCFMQIHDTVIIERCRFLRHNIITPTNFFSFRWVEVIENVREDLTHFWAPHSKLSLQAKPTNWRG